MKISKTYSRSDETQGVIVRATILDAEPRLIHWMSKRRWRPVRVTVKWTRSRVNGGEWSEWRSGLGKVHGPSVRADGTDGTGEHHDYASTVAGVNAWIETTRPGDELPAGFDLVRDEAPEPVDLDTL